VISKDCSRITEHLLSGVEEWTAGSVVGPERIQYDSLEKAIVVTQMQRHPIYFYLPKKFLGDLRFAYNQIFGFTLRTMFNNSAASPRFVYILMSNQRSTFAVTSRLSAPMIKL
jgi:hypothetical protein